MGGRTYALAPTIGLVWVPDGDHSFKPRKKSGLTLTDSFATAHQAITSFIGRLA